MTLDAEQYLSRAVELAMQAEEAGIRGVAAALSRLVVAVRKLRREDAEAARAELREFVQLAHRMRGEATAHPVFQGVRRLPRPGRVIDWKQPG